MGILISTTNDIIKTAAAPFDTRSKERKYKDSLAGGTSLETISGLMLSGVEYINKKNIKNQIDNFESL
tara:strand:- start:1122 stop:1325 length:204 start_codon:yes stop_codon:yes gene_type:complete